VATLCCVNTGIKTGVAKSYGNEAAEKTICNEWLNVSRGVATLETLTCPSVTVNSKQSSSSYSTTALSVWPWLRYGF